MHGRVVRLITLLILIAMLQACSTAPAEKSAMMSQVEGIDVSKRELQTVMYNYAAHFAGEVELATNEIYSASDDIAVRRNAIEWNLNAPPEMARACFNHDPLVGLLGAWTFTIEMREFFEKGNGRDLFGPYQGDAVETAKRLENDISTLAHAVWPQGDIDKYEGLVTAFAQAHPLRNLRFVREGSDQEALKALGSDVSGGFAAAGEMSEQMVALTDRANLMIPALQRRLYWNGALMKENAEEFLTAWGYTMIDTLIDELFGGLDPMYAFMDAQRKLVAGDVARERAAVFEGIARERSEVVNAMAAEREQIFAAIDRERALTMQDMDALVLAVLQRVRPESERAVTFSVDHVLKRVLQIMAIPFILAAVFTIVVIIWIRNTVDRVLRRIEGNTSMTG